MGHGGDREYREGSEPHRVSRGVGLRNHAAIQRRNATPTLPQAAVRRQRRVGLDPGGFIARMLCATLRL